MGVEFPGQEPDEQALVVAGTLSATSDKWPA
jgi:hypothetical protein